MLLVRCGLSVMWGDIYFHYLSSWHVEADSYGCHKYVSGDATKERLSDNTTTVQCTGGFKLNDKDAYEVLRFGESSDDQISKDAINSQITGFNGPSSKDTAIYVFGLAGNFCVHDTTTHLTGNGFKNVNVLNKYTMYADDSDPANGSLSEPNALPIQFTESNDTFQDTKQYLESKQANLMHDIDDKRIISTNPSAELQRILKESKPTIEKIVKNRGDKRCCRKNTPKSRQRRR